MKSSTSGFDIMDRWRGLDQRVKIGVLVGLGIIVILLCIIAILVARRAFMPAASEPTAAPSPLETTAPTAQPTNTPPPTDTPAPTDTPQPTDTPEPSDAQGDAVLYESGDAAETIPAGVDIRVASVAPDMSIALQSTADVPAELGEWAEEGEALFWFVLYEPIAETPEQRLEWIFILDMDGDSATGRPAGQRPINQGLGDEAAISVFYDPESAQYATYCVVWDTAGSNWVPGPAVRYYINESRTLVGLAISAEALTTEVSETSAVTVDPEAVKGRAAALAGKGAQRVADFYPDRSE